MTPSISGATTFRPAAAPTILTLSNCCLGSLNSSNDYGLSKVLTLVTIGSGLWQIMNESDSLRIPL